MGNIGLIVALFELQQVFMNRSTQLPWRLTVRNRIWYGLEVVLRGPTVSRYPVVDVLWRTDRP